MSKWLNKKSILFISITVLLTDIITKIIVVKYMNVNDSIELIKNLFYLTYVHNDGIAFSMLRGSKFVIILITLIVLFLITKYIVNNNIKKYEVVSFSLLIGGALGNLIDRIIYGYVIDFIDIYIFSYDYPIFNIADIAVVIGAFILIITGIKKDKYLDKNKE